MRVAAIIPARNEAETIAPVIDAARAAVSVDEVIVVDNGSTDATGEVAAVRGARIVFERAQGKGEAMRRGVAATDADVIVFLDADLLGLKGRHVDLLVRKVVSGVADMACGLCDRGSFWNTVQLRHLPILSGQRALHRALFEALELKEVSGYRVEVALNSLVAQRKLRRHVQVLPGVTHRMQEEKAPNPVTGFARKLRMLLSAGWSYLSYGVRHRMFGVLSGAERAGVSAPSRARVSTPSRD